MGKLFIILIFCLFLFSNDFAQDGQIWHGKERSLRYVPDHGDFVITNGTKRFNRALYGSNTAFRVETGDLPEFSMYLPGMGGNLKFGLMVGNNSKWLNEAEKIIARYRAGSMIYEIQDRLLGKGMLKLTVLARTDAEGMIIKAESQGVSRNVSLVFVYGGVSGAKFSRNGDLNVDPESGFYLKPANCKTNSFEIRDNFFTLYYGAVKSPSDSERYNLADSDEGTKETAGQKRLIGIVPPGSVLKIADAAIQESPLAMFNSEKKDAPVLTGKISLNSGKPLYYLIKNPQENTNDSDTNLSAAFEKAEKDRQLMAGRIKVNTPDPFINTLGGTLAMAADAIWEDPTYMHGAIGWRMRLNGWRGPYTADPLGWHDRAKTHFTAYVRSQVLSPDSGPSVPDPEKNLARQKEKMGVSLFTNGYVCRNPNGKLSPNHYDMNLVFFDAMLRHFKWTGDTAFLKEMWPAIKRHLAWEKRNFDANNDGLYDAYCCIWASDALQYSGGGVSHSSAYNYYAEKTAAYLAGLLGEDPEPFTKEAEKIYNAMNSNLWLGSKGWFAEYKDLLGHQLLHPSAALWTVYHTIDSEVPDPFQAYSMTRYVDNEIPHIPVIAKGLKDEGYYVLSTTNWLPYDWSINNVVMAENLHTALAYWQSGRGEEAFKLWKSTLLDAMYLGSSPGNFVQVSFYDAARGESYRDFADEVGMTARSLVEGLFGIQPDAPEGVLTIRPGLPLSWDSASMTTPDVSFDFKRKGNKETYNIRQSLPRLLKIKFVIKALKESVKSVTLNGKEIEWKIRENSIQNPEIEIVTLQPLANAVLNIEWEGKRPDQVRIPDVYTNLDTIHITCPNAVIQEILDPQQALKNVKVSGRSLSAGINGETGGRTVFARVKQGQLSWYIPICFNNRKIIEVLVNTNRKFSLKNNSQQIIRGKITVNTGMKSFSTDISLKPGMISGEITIPEDKEVFGTNLIRISASGNTYEETFTNWDDENTTPTKYETVDLTPSFNDKVSEIFAPNKYLFPRCPFPTLALPSQGIGNWCYPNIDFKVDDTGLRKLAGSKNEIRIPGNVPFATPGSPEAKNIVFTSNWDNYPSEVSIPLAGKASHAYFLMAGSTNPMQSRMINGEVVIEYADGGKASLALVNPDTWWPIEQDYLVDGFAFSISKPKPFRVHLKTGLITRSFADYSGIKGYSDRAIEGGAATVLDLPLDPSRELKNVRLISETNDVVIGLMSVTLERP